MANSKKTPNSLNDLTNDGVKFNRNLKEEDISTNSRNLSIDPTQQKIDEEAELRRKANSAKNDSEREELSGLFNKKNNEARALQTTTSTESDFDTDTSSLFDSNALIDYARYVNTDGSVQRDWKNFNSTADNKGNLTFNINSAQTRINQPVPYNDSSLPADEGLSLPNLIEWSEQYPALQLKFQDFAYCKKLGYYPNNRLIVLRRFKSGVPDNLFDYVNTSSRVEFNQPLSTLITWWNPEEDIGDMNFTFNENWEGYEKGLMSTFKASVSNLTGIASKSGGENGGSGANDLITALLSDSLVTAEQFRREDGVPYSRSSLGSPNVIADAMARKTGGEGLSSSINFRLKFEYEMRDINGIDPGIAMLDLISNCTRMGTSVAEFRYNVPALKEAESVKALINGDINKALQSFKTDLKNFTDGISQIFQDVSDNLGNISVQSITSGAGNLLTSGATYIISRYRENLKAALSVDTGLPSGIWHVTIGNPKSPIISCGDLIIKESKLKLGKELGFNDFPNEFSVEYSLETARPRGRDELTRIMNAGRGRVYVYPTAKDNPDYDLYGSDQPDTTVQNKIDAEARNNGN